MKKAVVQRAPRPQTSRPVAGTLPNYTTATVSGLTVEPMRFDRAGLLLLLAAPLLLLAALVGLAVKAWGG